MTSLRISIPLDDAPPSKLHPRSPIQERLESALPNRPSLAELHEAQQKAEARARRLWGGRGGAEGACRATPARGRARGMTSSPPRRTASREHVPAVAPRAKEGGATPSNLPWAT